MKKRVPCLFIAIILLSCSNNSNTGHLTLIYLNHASRCDTLNAVYNPINPVCKCYDDFIIECENTCSDTLCFWVGDFSETPFAVIQNGEKKKCVFWNAIPHASLKLDSIQIVPHSTIKLIYINDEMIKSPKRSLERFDSLIYQDKFIIKKGDSLLLK
jgi:hypothetical protein